MVRTGTIKNQDLRFDFPKDYKDWTHAVSKIILDKSSQLYGFQQVFVNETALNAYKKGGGYPDGSMILIGFYEAVTEGDDINQGGIIWYAAMKRDARAVKTGGWIFDGFDGTTLKSKIDNSMTGCFICHMGQKNRDYVFTQFAGEIAVPGEPGIAISGRSDFPATQGDIIWYATMKKDSNNAEKTGGWVMDGFDGKTLKSKIDNPLTGCFICHTSQKENDYVFSKYVP